MRKNEENRRRGGRFPGWALPGILLVLAGLLGLWSVPAGSQYAFLPGSETNWREKMNEAEERWAEPFPGMCLYGTADGAALTAGECSQEDICLTEVMGDYFHVCPRSFSAGRPLSAGDEGEQVIVLEGALAFRLFGDRDPLGRTVRLQEKDYTVVGVTDRGLNRLGSPGSYAAWIPLGAAGAPAPRMMVFSAAGAEKPGARTVFEAGAREIFGEGQAVFPEKEKARGTVMLRIVLILIGFGLLFRWTGRMKALFRGWIRELRELGKTRYPRQMAGRICLRAAGMLGLTALTVAAAAGLVVWGSRLMILFPEWVPENLVSPETIARRFRELTAAAAAPISFRTPELAVIRFWSGMIRWGLVLALLGAAAGGWKRVPACGERADRVQ